MPWRAVASPLPHLCVCGELVVEPEEPDGDEQERGAEGRHGREDVRHVFDDALDDAEDHEGGEVLLREGLGKHVGRPDVEGHEERVGDDHAGSQNAFDGLPLVAAGSFLPNLLPSSSGSTYICKILS